MLRSRVIDPIAGQPRQGVNSRAIAPSVAFGIVLGLFPVIGATTVLCFAAALALRLNHVAIQAVNYVVYPLQIVLLIPFMRMGEALFVLEPVPLSLEQLQAYFEQGWLAALAELGELIALGIAAWSVVAVPLAAAIFFTTVPLLHRVRWIAE